MAVDRKRRSRLGLARDTPLSVSALHYTVDQLDDGDGKDNRHSELITPADCTNWCIDKVQMGLGCVNSWGATARPEYLLPLGDYEYTFILRPASLTADRDGRHCAGNSDSTVCFRHSFWG